MKLTRHNGRSGKNGAYNPRHNDRCFDLKNSEHIDAERTDRNVYWDCYRGITIQAFRESPEQPDFSFEEVERMYLHGSLFRSCMGAERLQRKDPTHRAQPDCGGSIKKQ